MVNVCGENKNIVYLVKLFFFMNEIDKIKLLNELKDGQETLNLWKHYSKYLDIKIYFLYLLL